MSNEIEKMTDKELVSAIAAGNAQRDGITAELRKLSGELRTREARAAVESALAGLTKEQRELVLKPKAIESAEAVGTPGAQ